MVFFSEKAYWYVQGYAIGGLILYYAFPVFACLLAIEYFHVRRLAAVILVAALYAFLIEGVLTPVIYEAGMLDPVMPAYFIGWHGLISLVFGWYWLRKMLVQGQVIRLLVGGTLFGLFWGLWALTFWLPESILEFEQLAASGEPAIPGIWSWPEFGAHALIFTLVLLASHWLLGHGGWQQSFKASKGEKWLVLIALVFFFITLVLIVLPLAIFKLTVLLGIVLIPLLANRRREDEGSLFRELQGSVKFSHTLTLLVMPLAATIVYALALSVQPPEEVLRTILESTPLLQVVTGSVAFLWALAATFIHPRKLAPGTDQVNQNPIRSRNSRL
jgi:hypothetical protein